MNTQQAKVYNIVVTIILSTFLGTLPLLLQNNFTWTAFAYNFISGAFVGYTIGDLVAVPSFAVKVRDGMGLSEDTFIGYFTRVAIQNFIMVSIIGFFANIIGTGLTGVSITNWFSSYPESILLTTVLMTIVVGPLENYIQLKF